MKNVHDKISLSFQAMLFLLIPFLLLLLNTTEADPGGGGGCFFFQEQRAVRCTNSSTAEVSASLSSLLDSPITVEAIDCPLQENGAEPLDLPASVRSLRLFRCATPLSVIRSAHITELDLSGNGLEESPRLSHLVTLKRLLLRGNRISRLHASHLPASLVELDLTGNRLGVMADHGRNGYTLKGEVANFCSFFVCVKGERRFLMKYFTLSFWDSNCYRIAHILPVF